MSSVLRAYGALDLFGTDGYPLAWHDPIKHLVREQACHRCERCGHPYLRDGDLRGAWSPCDGSCRHGGPLRAFGLDGPSEVTISSEDLARDHIHAGDLARVRGVQVDAMYRVLTVHHLDGDKANCRWFNLVSLCQRCHLTVQGKVRIDRCWPYEHTDWFKPYAAGYYAFARLGQDLDRPAVEQRLDELLALEHRQQELELEAIG